MLTTGVASTSVDDVLVEAHASKSQLYHYFTNKQDLVAAVVEHARSLVLSSQQAMLADITDWTGLDAWADHIVDTTTRHDPQPGCPLGTLAAELATTDDTARRLLADAFSEWEHRLRDTLITMRDRALLRPDTNIDELAIATIASLQGGLLLAKTTQSTTPLRIALDAALAHLRTHAR